MDGFSTTGPPTPWPQIDVLTSRPEKMEPGYTLFAMNAYNQNNGSYLTIMDPEGEVVWCYELNGGFALDAHINQAGRVLALLGGDITELDLLGNVLDRWNESGAGGATRVNVASFHHEAYEMPDGNLPSQKWH